MNSERNLNAVAPTPLTADGGAQGQIQVASVLGLFVKQNIVLQAPSLPPLNVQVKFIVSSTQILVGSSAMNLAHRIDVSAYTVALNSFLFANAQPKTVLPMEERIQASYNQEPINAWSVKPVDSYGNSVDSTNPFPVNIVPATQIPFTLGSLTLPTLINQYASGLTFTEVTSDSIGTEEVLTFYDGSTNVGEINISQSEDGWVLNLGVPEEDFLLLETGSFFVLEDDSGGILLE